MIYYYFIIFNQEIQIKLPDIPLDMSVCDGSDYEDFEVKHEPMDSDTVKPENFPTEFESGDSNSDLREMLFDAQFQKFNSSGK